MTALNLQLNERVKFSGDDSRYWWTVRAADDRFAVLTRYAPFRKRPIAYTIIDTERDLRGPCDLIGQGWDFNTESDDTIGTSARKLLTALRGGIDTLDDESLPDDERISIPAVEVSHRNNVPIDIIERKLA
ncbi:MAG: hypothetical protein K0S37_4793 [Microbacterium sp.]|nr:hypothetical protein [Microbacterium sp.]